MVFHLGGLKIPESAQPAQWEMYCASELVDMVKNFRVVKELRKILTS
jgi:hypothetical protein